jgi:hypothetical protein
MTLPVCQVRKLAYSTLALAKLGSDGRASLTELDSPHAFVLHDRKTRRLGYETRTIEGRATHLASTRLEFGDWLVLVSDGVLNAGIGAALDLGWEWDSIARFLETHAHPNLTALQLAQKLGATVLQLYENHCGDDVTVAVLKARRRRFATVMSGPPTRRENDAAVVRRLLAARGQRVVCGGTTANIVARALGVAVTPDLATMAEEVPPLGVIEGIDLVTEGVLTLSKTLENLRNRVTPEAIQFKIDGASALTRALLHADEITFLVGRALNPAHQNPSLPAALGLKSHVIHEIALELQSLGKTVTVEEF